MKALSEYDKQAVDFLEKHNLRMRITRSKTQTPPPWHGETKSQSHGAKYYVTISRPGERISFSFWGSVADREKGEDPTPTPYDVLACISGDVYCPETFEEFCNEYGYNNDSISDLKTFRRLSEFAKRLRAFFSEDEREDLVEIR